MYVFETRIFDMKTEQILVRKFNNLDIRQNHLTQMLNANDLFAAYRMTDPNTSKSVVRFMDNESTKSFVEHLIQTEGVPANLVVSSKRGSNGGTWMHPYLFLDFAMWLSVDFKLIAIKWIHDNLCSLRDTAGDDFKELNKVIKDTLNPDKPYVYSNECRLIQGIAGVDTGGRNLSDAEKLDRLKKLQRADIKLLRSGELDYSKRKRRLLEFAEML